MFGMWVGIVGTSDTGSDSRHSAGCGESDGAANQAVVSVVVKHLLRVSFSLAGGKQIGDGKYAPEAVEHGLDPQMRGL
jgi:hypothetical protein